MKKLCPNCGVVEVKEGAKIHDECGGQLKELPSSPVGIPPGQSQRPGTNLTSLVDSVQNVRGDDNSANVGTINIFNTPPVAAVSHARLMTCDICGTNHTDPTNTFTCRNCRKENLCRDHRRKVGDIFGCEICLKNPSPPSSQVHQDSTSDTNHGPQAGIAFARADLTRNERVLDKRKVSDSGGKYDEFFKIFLEEINRKTSLFSQVKTSGDPYVVAKPFRGIEFVGKVTRNDASVNLYINSGNLIKNEDILNFLEKRKQNIVSIFGNDLYFDWKKGRPNLRDAVAKEIIYLLKVGNWNDRSLWPTIHSRMTEKMVLLEKALMPHLQEYFR